MNEHPVMVVDDDVDIRDSLTDLLEQDGFAVLTAANGQEALQRLRAGARPCLILLDLMMPVMDGQTFRKEQLQDPTLSSIPVIVVTAGGRAMADGLGAQVFVKPVRADAILKAVRSLC